MCNLCVCVCSGLVILVWYLKYVQLQVTKTAIVIFSDSSLVSWFWRHKPNINLGLNPLFQRKHSLVGIVKLSSRRSQLWLLYIIGAMFQSACSPRSLYTKYDVVLFGLCPLPAANCVNIWNTTEFNTRHTNSEFGTSNMNIHKRFTIIGQFFFLKTYRDILHRSSSSCMPLV